MMFVVGRLLTEGRFRHRYFAMAPIARLVAPLPATLLAVAVTYNSPDIV